jgi:hypothetical protein
MYYCCTDGNRSMNNNNNCTSLKNLHYVLLQVLCMRVCVCMRVCIHCIGTLYLVLRHNICAFLKEHAYAFIALILGSNEKWGPTSLRRCSQRCEGQHTPGKCVYSHTYRHTHINTYIHTYIHIFTLHTYIHIHTYTHTYIHTYTRTYIRTYIHTYIRTYIHTHTHMRNTYLVFGVNIGPFLDKAESSCLPFFLEGREERGVAILNTVRK